MWKFYSTDAKEYQHVDAAVIIKQSCKGKKRKKGKKGQKGKKGKKGKKEKKCMKSETIVAQSESMKSMIEKGN